MPGVKVEPSQSSQGSLLEVMDAEGLDTFVDLVQRQASLPNIYLACVGRLQPEPEPMASCRGPRGTRQSWQTPSSCCRGPTLCGWGNTYTSR